MNSKFNSDDSNTMSYILVCESEVIEVSDAFLLLTEYKKAEILNKNIEHILNDFLRLNININKIEQSPKSFFIFTKSLEPREVVITISNIKDGNVITITEKPHSRLEQKLPYVEHLYNAEKSGVAIYSAPDLILLKANHTHIQYLNEPYNKKENCIGKRLDEFIKGYKGSNLEQIWISILNTGEVLRSNEFMYDRFDRGITYWDSSIVPIYENGKIKYFVENATEVTEKVLSRKRIEEQNIKLKYQAELLQKITENMNDALFIINKDGTYEYFNEHAKKMTQQPENIKKIGDSLVHTAYYDESGREITKDEMPCSRVLRGEKIQNVVLRSERPNFNAYFNFNGSPIYDDNGELASAILCFHDVTEKYKREKEIKEKKEQLETIFETMSDILMVSDKEGNILAMNSIAKNLKYSPARARSLNYNYGIIQYRDMDNNLIPLDELPHKRALKGEKIENFRFSIKQSDKEVYIDANVSPVFDANGNFDIAVICCRDITDLINKEREITKQKEQLETVIENISDLLMIIDKNGKIVKVNKSLEEYTKINVDSKYVQDIVAALRENVKFYDEAGEEISIEKLPTSVVLRGQKVEQQIIMIQRQGRNIYQEMSGIPVFNKEGEIQFGVITSRDVTERVEYHKLKENHDQFLLKAEMDKNKELEAAINMKDEFISMVSHEFKTPLTVINSAIQVIELLCTKEMTDKLKGFLKMIKQNSFRQLRLVNNLLDISRLNAGRIKINKRNIDIVFLTKSIVESVRLYSDQKGIKLDFLSEFEHKLIGIDEEKYERILLNLLSNAIKFTPNSKTITVELSSGKGKICIEVKDEGVGIPEDKKELIFERFGQIDSSFTRQSEGTGIGLFLVKLFVEALGGSISVKSEIGKGSTFYVLLPDTKVAESLAEKAMQEFSDNRIIQSATIEFSDIYLI